jgi:hypothetical protein
LKIDCAAFNSRQMPLGNSNAIGESALAQSFLLARTLELPRQYFELMLSHMH